MGQAPEAVKSIDEVMRLLGLFRNTGSQQVSDELMDELETEVLLLADDCLVEPCSRVVDRQIPCLYRYEFRGR